ncbi:hydroxymethylglutaryl-CoA synthase [Eremomyces bilateralis CBS 781.70]|uniref:Hydroxymethylglutaryl-CoA synthase n=1 Tax=Eremomyces bilateralis CBS 781.70 TaxID=1392243 RepID=A0A6G1GAM6_9PEZI|nr:hydroxymethylglutaryl-CoA synthase [Eremomyces bilateralis CBS 781.70]KAF1815147.1 hydroxymethylglutaryl-CoA synthase [Eremomyces bilateralis CBS 781.70]
MAARPQNIGIKAIEIYFPSQCVDQAELEKFDGVSQGKYTIGLGQTKMSFCDDREDIYSLALTSLTSLMKKYNIDPNSIGRLEVGTETILDKSKSVKSVLMQVFQPSGNTNIEGVDNVNACYGGTNALFNAVDWVESSAWDGRDAIIVTGDIALYKQGAARPTGGAGCVAMLVGPDAPIVFEAGLRGSYLAHTYDFYKPDLTSEYPIVDGHYSIKCYLEAVDGCYKAYNAREKALKQAANGVNGVHEADTPLDRFDYMCFHAPTCKLVAKSYGRLLYNDYLADKSNPAFADVPAALADVSHDASLTDKTVEKTFMGLTKKKFEARVKPTTNIPTMCGNMYCASVYGGLASLLSLVSSDELQGKRVGIFSFGSGLASSLFSLRVRGSTAEMAKQLNIQERLEARRTVDPQVYDDMCNLREKAHLKKNYSPAGNAETLVPGTYYLTEIDDLFRRKYAIKE